MFYYDLLSETLSWAKTFQTFSGSISTASVTRANKIEPVEAVSWHFAEKIMSLKFLKIFARLVESSRLSSCLDRLINGNIWKKMKTSLTRFLQNDQLQGSLKGMGSPEGKGCSKDILKAASGQTIKIHKVTLQSL